MPDSLFQQLKRIGLDEELSHQVAASLDPDHNASKKDVLVLQEAILQVQARTDERYHQLRLESDQRYHELKADIDKNNHALKADIDKSIHELKDAVTNIRIEFHSRHRQAIYAFGALLASIFTVLLVNFYLH